MIIYSILMPQKESQLCILKDIVQTVLQNTSEASVATPSGLYCSRMQGTVKSFLFAPKFYVLCIWLIYLQLSGTSLSLLYFLN